MTTTRPWASGSVSQRADGRFWARLPLTHGRRSLGIYQTREEAEAVLAAALEQLVEVPLAAPTLAIWGILWLGTRSVRASVLERDRARWRAYVERSELGGLTLAEISPSDVARWWRHLRGSKGQPLAAQTRLNAAALVRGALASACAHDGPLAGRTSPAQGLELPRGARARKDPGWTWMRQAELEQLLGCQAVPLSVRCTYAFAAFSGLRAGELWALTWDDVDVDRGVIIVRQSRAEATKGGRPREVPLLGPARAAFEWLRELPRQRSHLGLIWPGRSGGYAHEGHDMGWPRWRRVAGISRRVRFHDLRHTCASHLLQGTWAPAVIARPLRLEEVKEWLGHSDITVTQRYAHLCVDAIAALAVRPEAAPQLGTGLGTGRSHTGDLNSGPTVYEGVAQPANLRAIASEQPPGTTPVPKAARDVLELIAAGSPFALLRAVAVLERVALGECGCASEHSPVDVRMQGAG